MCSDPQTNGQITFACRKCNECIATRKNDWVARAMAEKATSAETIGIELTYRNNPDDTKPDAAKAFKYQDVKEFLKRLREEYYRKYHARGEIRFICAGERGSKKGRVHWHMVIFADRPFSHLGTWQDFVFKKLDGPQFSEFGKKAKMLHWKFWPHGHVVVKRPDQGGMQYVLKYAMKDQFSSVRSKGTMRFSKSEETAASYFRMSKHPAIGARYLERQCDRWESKLAVPPNLWLNVPEYKGYWYPKLGLREYLLDRLHQINERSKAEKGRECPQWNTLLTSVVDQEKDWEGLVYGPQEIEITDDEKAVFKRYSDFQVEQFKGELETRGAASREKNCGGVLPCRKCWEGLERDRKAGFRRWYEAQFDEYLEHVRKDRETHITFDGWYRANAIFENPYCQQKVKTY